MAARAYANADDEKKNLTDRHYNMKKRARMQRVDGKINGSIYIYIYTYIYIYIYIYTYIYI